MLLGIAPLSAQYTIRTVAGGGPPDGVLATSVGLDTYGVATDSAGNFYVAAAFQGKIIKVSSTGLITTVAGNGGSAFSGDGGPATAAQLSQPSDVVVDNIGNLFIADTANNRIRKVTPAGVITTVAGNGFDGFSGDGGPAVSARFSGPSGLAVDSGGNLYIADTYNNRIRKVTPSGVVTTVAGTGAQGFAGDGGLATAAQLDTPFNLTLDGSGNLYVSDFGNNRIRKISSGNISTFAGNGNDGYSGDGGPATSAALSGPGGLAIDSAGNLYIADTYNHRVRRVAPNGVIISVAGNGRSGFSGDGGPAIGAQLYRPYAVAIDTTGIVYVADNFNNRIRKITAGLILTVAGNGSLAFSGDGGAALQAQFASPADAKVDAAGNLVIPDANNNRIRKVSPGPAGIITTIAGTGADGYSGDGGPAANASLSFPLSAAVDAAGNIYFVDTYNYVVRKITGTTITTVAGGGFTYSEGVPATSAYLYNPSAVAVDSTGNLFIADSRDNWVRKVSPTGVITNYAGVRGNGGYAGDNGPARSAQLSGPTALAVDAAGNLYIADTGNNRIRKVSTTGTITTVAGNGESFSGGDGGLAVSAQLAEPMGIAVDAAGNLYIGERLHARKVRATTGIITTIAGNGIFGFSGDGGPATNASVGAGVLGISVDTAGVVYFADATNNRVRALTPVLAVQPATLNFTATPGGPAPAPQTLTVTNGADGTATVSVTSGNNWLSATPATGVVPLTVSVSVNPTGLAAGAYTGNVRVTAASGTVDVPVTISILAACTYNLTPSTYSTAATAGSSTFTVNTATGCAWTATSNAAWVTISSGASASGSGTVTFQVAANSGALRTATITVTGGNTFTINQASPSLPQTGLRFVPLPPCRVMETRSQYNFEGRTGAFGPPTVNALETRTLNLPSSNVCAIPASAKAYVVNVTVIPATGLGFATLWPAGDPQPNTWTIRSPDGQIVANSAIVRAGVNGGVSLYASDRTDVLIDISGYFTDTAAANALVYYPLTPCRVVETRSLYRSPNGPFGPPSMGAGETRKFRFPASPYCTIPAAAAYSVTITAVPPAALAYLTAWPDGVSQPNVSSINSFAGRVLANSVIVPASADGTIDVFTFNATDFLVDINGYFAPDDGRGLLYYPVTQCRASDTTATNSPYSDNTTRTIAVPLVAGCSGIPSTAQGYAINVTAIPGGSPMPYLTAYPTGQPQPNASILNAFQGQVVTNSAIIPAGTGGAIDIYAYRKTDVVLEISGYFSR